VRTYCKSVPISLCSGGVSLLSDARHPRISLGYVQHRQLVPCDSLARAGVARVHSVPKKGEARKVVKFSYVVFFVHEPN
jgi:hypothetical protein